MGHPHTLATPPHLETRLDRHAVLTLAYENHHAAVFDAWRVTSAAEQFELLTDRYVLLSVCTHAPVFAASRVVLDFAQTQHFIDRFIEQLLAVSASQHGRSEDWFAGLNRLADGLVELHFLAQAHRAITLAFDTGVHRFPGHALKTKVLRAWVRHLAGQRELATQEALDVIQRPFLISNPKELPRIQQHLCHLLAAGSQLEAYRHVLWQGVANPATPHLLRDRFIHDIRQSHRGAWRALMRPEAPLVFRLPLLVGLLGHGFFKVPPLRAMGLHTASFGLHTALLKALRRWTIKRVFRPQAPAHPAPRVGAAQGRLWARLRSWRPAPRRILITRAMGGIGDLLMMTPGLVALRARHPRAQIDFATQKGLHPVLQGLEGLRLLDIHTDPIDLGSYRTWINLSDCPAGRVESRQSPNVRTNRIEAFAQAMGVGRWRLRRSGVTPRYQVSPQEAAAAERFMARVNPDGRTVIGIQPFSADSYKNWPHFQELATRLSREHLVLVFHSEPMEGFEAPHVVQVVQPLRHSFAIAARCDQLITPDSSFAHLAAAVGVGLVAIFGPTSGKVFTRHYRQVSLVTPDKAQFPCFPCWRHEHKVCHLSQGRESVCMASITPQKVVDALERGPAPTLGAHPWRALRQLAQTLQSWFLYGRQ